MGGEWENGKELEEVIKVLWDEGILRKEDLYEVVKQKLLANKSTEDMFGMEEDKKGKKRARIESDEDGKHLRLASAILSIHRLMLNGRLVV